MGEESSRSAAGVSLTQRQRSARPFVLGEEASLSAALVAAADAAGDADAAAGDARTPDSLGGAAGADALTPRGENFLFFVRTPRALAAELRAAGLAAAAAAAGRKAATSTAAAAPAAARLTALLCQRDCDGRTPLQRACGRGRCAAAGALLVLMERLRCADTVGAGHPSELHFLLLAPLADDADDDDDDTDADGTVLADVNLAAALVGEGLPRECAPRRCTLAALLLRHPRVVASLNSALGPRGATKLPLLLALASFDTPLARLFLARGALPQATDALGRNALHYVAKFPDAAEAAAFAEVMWRTEGHSLPALAAEAGVDGKTPLELATPAPRRALWAQVLACAYHRAAAHAAPLRSLSPAALARAFDARPPGAAAHLLAEAVELTRLRCTRDALRPERGAAPVLADIRGLVDALPPECHRTHGGFAALAPVDVFRDELARRCAPFLAPLFRTDRDALLASRSRTVASDAEHAHAFGVAQFWAEGLYDEEARLLASLEDVPSPSAKVATLRRVFAPVAEKARARSARYDADPSHAMALCSFFVMLPRMRHAFAELEFMREFALPGDAKDQILCKFETALETALNFDPSIRNALDEICSIRQVQESFRVVLEALREREEARAAAIDILVTLCAQRTFDIPLADSLPAADAARVVACFAQWNVEVKFEDSAVHVTSRDNAPNSGIFAGVVEALL